MSLSVAPLPRTTNDGSADYYYYYCMNRRSATSTGSAFASPLAARTRAARQIPAQTIWSSPYFWSFPSTVYEEIIHRFYAKIVIDITPGQGTFGEMCIKHRIGYFCVAFTEAHAQFLHNKFQASALQYMADESSALFLPKCAEAMGKKADKKPEAKKRPKPTGKKEPPGADPSGEPTGKNDPPAAKAGAKKRKNTVKTEPGAEGGGIGSDNGGNSEISWDLSDEY